MVPMHPANAVHPYAAVRITGREGVFICSLTRKPKGLGPIFGVLHNPETMEKRNGRSSVVPTQASTLRDWDFVAHPTATNG